MSTVPPSNEVMMDFLRSGIDLMSSDVTRKMLRDKAGCPDPGKKLIELQRQGWDPLGVDRNRGCMALDNIAPTNASLNQAKQEFCNIAMRTFLQCLDDRRPTIL